MKNKVTMPNSKLCPKKKKKIQSHKKESKTNIVTQVSSSHWKLMYVATLVIEERKRKKEL